MKVFFKIPEKRAEISSLRELQSDMFQHNTLYEKFNKQRAELEEKAIRRNRKCYKAQLAQLYLYECTKSLTEKAKLKPPAKLLCANEKEYLGAAFIYIMKILVPLRENPSFFGFLSSCIDTSKDVPEETSDKLAEEMAFLFFADFISPERFHHLFLRHINYLLPVLFKTCKAQKKAYPFEIPFFVNKLLREYVKRPEVRNYTRLLFANALTKILDLSTRVQHSQQFTPDKRYTMYFASEGKSKTMDLGQSLYNGHSYINHLPDTTDEASEPGTPTKEIEGMEIAELLEICEEILETIQKQLIYFPLELRFLCKLIENHVKENYVEENEDPVSIVKRLVMDFIFHKWWLTALMKPQENGLVEICTTDSCFSKKVVYILKILRAVFYAPAEFDKLDFVPSVVRYIKSKEGLSDSYIAKLLEVKCPNFEEALESEINVNSICVSLSGIKVIHQLLYKNISELSQIKDVYAKCVNHLQFLLDSKSKDHPHIFAPTLQTFKVDAIEGITSSQEDLKSSSHYFVFQNISFKDSMRKDLFSEKWQHLLHRLLLEVDLSSHCGLPAESSTVEQNEILEILKQIAKHPMAYITNKDASTKVSLLAHYLYEFFASMGEELVPDAICDLKLKCEKNITEISEQIKYVGHGFRKVINAMTNILNSLSQTNAKYANEAIAGMVANRIIRSFPIPFRIYCEYPTTKSKQQKDPNNYHYSISFFERRKSGVMEISSLSLKMFVGKPKKPLGTLVSEGSSVKEFVGCFAQLKDLADIVRANKDSHNAGNVYKQFMEFLKEKVSTEAKIDLAFVDDADQVFEHIEKYVMQRLYPLVYPILPTEDDKEFLLKLQKLQTTKNSELLLESVPSEVLELTTNKLRDSAMLTTPQQKLANYEEAYRIIYEGLEITAKSQPVQYDSTQVLIFAILHANLSRIISDINYIEWFRTNCTDQGKKYTEYCYCNIKFAVAFLKDFKNGSKSPKKEQQADAFLLLLYIQQ
eukprot:TRINITY_DN89110_c0_g1_i1.p1 TRINITY_DN89110_c0_g1~~TRINITY_DN89110_c0_g1_i1.p1  ORF type:complete len:1013 (-),score=106.12 TRINITY_DN89110_c0_g1_i1:723-3668(-)